MSLLQNEEFVIYQLRSAYLSTIKDGVGERLININHGVLNTPGFRSAGWLPNPADHKRTYSPPIPTAIASEYFQVPPRSASFAPPGFNDEEDEGGMVTGKGSEETVGPNPNLKLRRRKEQMDDEESSDLSDDSEDEGEGNARPAQQIKFGKMPVRHRAGSSPIRSSNTREGPSLLITSPSVRTGAQGFRRGSLGAVEAVKQRARRDTTTSSEMSSENELDASMFKRKRIDPSGAAKSSRMLAQKLAAEERGLNRDIPDLIEENDSGDDTDGSDGTVGTNMSSEFAETVDSTSLLQSVNPRMTSSGLNALRAPLAQNINTSSKRTRISPATLQALPPPRPISVVPPVSALALLIQARRAKPTMPFESFAPLDGKADANHLRLKIYFPTSNNPEKAYDVPIRRTAHDGKKGVRPIRIADLIGLSLWKYNELGASPPMEREKMNVNWWTIRLVEDGEVEYDFPPLDRRKELTQFTSNNNQAARGRTRNKPYDEFALVQATEAQFQENESITPDFKQEVAADVSNDLPSPLQASPSNQQQQPPSPPRARRNPVLTIGTHRIKSDAPIYADISQEPVRHTVPRIGPSKLLRIHLLSPEGYPQLITVDVTTDTYVAEVLDIACKKRNLSAAQHYLKLSNTNIIVPSDRTVESIGERADLDLIRQRFQAPLFITGSPGSTSPNAPLLVPEEKVRKGSKARLGGLLHPLAQKQDVFSSANYKKYTVWRKQPMSFMPTHERVLAIDGDYIHLMPSEAGKTLFDSSAKTSTFPFSNVIGCKVSKKHPSNFRLVVFKARESKRYDFEAQSREEALDIVTEIKRGFAPYQAHDTAV
ncbi:MAG: hypothetical protein M1829_001952 [Trizodia sp. TS-e1964]|nr:MAG: hypothetical protein M1829_001952 [Trizodia sp. TS-e1964]